MVSLASPGDATKYGRRLLPTLVDELATSSPDHVYASIPRSQDLSDGLDDVTYRMLACAVSRAAFWIDRAFGQSNDFKTIAYIGPMDLRYFIVALGATKVGYKTLFPSPRNSVEGHLALLESTNCDILISPVESKVDHILTTKKMRHIEIEALSVYLHGDFTEYYQYNKTFEQAAQDPFIVVHTSGSTGLPKPITLYHGGVATMDSQHLIPSLDGFETLMKLPEKSVRIFTSLPPFHVACIIQNLIVALYFGETTVWPPAGRPISADLLDDLLDNVNVDALFTAPSTLEELSQSQASLERLKKVKYSQYAGGPLGKSAGDTVSKYTKVLNVMGSSESGYFPLLHTSPEDWKYFHFDPRMKGIEFREISSGLYEQYFTRHESTDSFHWSFYTFPDRSEFSMNDVFSKHPTKPDLWLYEGRSDDVIVFSNGEKLNPNGMEAILRSYPAISGALIVGQGRFEAAALLELKETMATNEEARINVLENLSPYINRANEIAPAYAKIDRDHVFFTKAGKPMVRTDKGTVKRRATNQAYENEIDQIYANIAGSGDASDAVQLDPMNQDALVRGIRDILAKMKGFQGISLDQDFFAVGMDSLQVINLVRQLRPSFIDHCGGVLTHLISPRTIYSSPTAFKLAAAIQYLAEHGEAGSEGLVLAKERTSKMEEVLAKYSHGLSEFKKHSGPRHKSGLSIVLTGSTGSLGSYLLDRLLAETRVTKVICLNRGSDGEIKQENSNRSRGLRVEWGGRVQFLTADLSKDDLGLAADDFELLVEEASAIIHNQWQVDFNLNLESFEPHIAGVRNLIDLSNQSSKSPPILFTSSISTLDNWATKFSGEKVPESGFHDFSVPAAMGYGESKYVAEQLLERAGKVSGVSAAICRVGQLAGPVVKNGVWSRQEWLPSLIASSKYLGKVPTSLPSQNKVAWIPVDITAEIIVNLLLSDIGDDDVDTLPTTTTAAWIKYHNVVNPQAGSWEALVPAIIGYFGAAATTIEPVSFASWFSALEASASTNPADLARNPGIKLLEFFGQMSRAETEVELETEQTVKRSAAMAGLKAVGTEWMDIWLRQWDL